MSFRHSDHNSGGTQGATDLLGVLKVLRIEMQDALDPSKAHGKVKVFTREEIAAINTEREDMKKLEEPYKAITLKRDKANDRWQVVEVVITGAAVTSTRVIDQSYHRDLAVDAARKAVRTL